MSNLRYRIDRYIARRRLCVQSYSIVANNCWGTGVYQYLGNAYMSPFVNLVIQAPCYLKILDNLEKYLACPLRFASETQYETVRQAREAKHQTYPIALLGDAELHCMHDSSEQDFRAKWERRLSRFSIRHVYFAFTDRDQATEELLARFDRLPYSRKVCFTARPHADKPSCVFIPECRGQPFVENLYTRAYLYKRHFDVVDWLNGGTGAPSLAYRLTHRMVEVPRRLSTDETNRAWRSIGR